MDDKDRPSGAEHLSGHRERARIKSLEGAVAFLTTKAAEHAKEIASAIDVLSKLSANQVTIMENLEVVMKSQMHIVQKGNHGKEEDDQKEDGKEEESNQAT